MASILRGRIERFSLADLFRCLNALGQDIEVTIRPAPDGEPHGQLSVAVSQAH